MSGQLDDKLNSLVESICRISAENSLAIYRTTALRELEPGLRRDASVIQWDSSSGSHLAFIECAKALGIRVLYLDSTNFSWQEDLADIIDEYRSSRRISEDDLSQRRAKAEHLRAFDGFVYDLRLGFFINGIWHLYVQPAEDWVTQFYDLCEDTRSVQLDSEGDEEPHDNEIEKYARALAEQPDFPNLRRDGRTEKLRKLFPHEANKVFEWSNLIIDKAEGIFQVELKPRNDRKIAAKAREMIQNGKNPRATADFLGLTHNALGKILQQYPEE